jgi:hypothetical protein
MFASRSCRQDIKCLNRPSLCAGVSSRTVPHPSQTPITSFFSRHLSAVGMTPRPAQGQEMLETKDCLLRHFKGHPFQGLCLLKQTGSDADRGNFAQDEGSFARVRCKISSRARGGGVMPIHQ